MRRKIAYWLSLPVRWFHRRGFGAHSPWAYEFITEALYCQYRYYIFEELNGTKADEQLFCINNWLNVKDVVMHCENGIKKAYLVAPLRRDELKRSDFTVYYYDTDHFEELKLDVEGKAFDRKSCVIIDGILDKNTDGWIKLLSQKDVTTVFDTGHRGIVFFDPQRQKQTYLT